MAERLAGGPLSPHELIAILRGVVDGLAAAHDQGIVHRDLKPDNIFLAEARSSEARTIPKILDFGLSKHLDPSESLERLTETAASMGTPLYMSPEQIRSSAHVDHRTDLYSLAVIVYEALSGRLPYEAPTIPALIVAVATEPPARLEAYAPHLPEALIDAVHTGLARDPADRPPSARAFLERLEAALASTPAALDAPETIGELPTLAALPSAALDSARAAMTEPEAPPPSSEQTLGRRRKGLILLLGIVALLALVLAAGQGMRRDAAPEPPSAPSSGETATGEPAPESSGPTVAEPDVTGAPSTRALDMGPTARPTSEQDPPDDLEAAADAGTQPEPPPVTRRSPRRARRRSISEDAPAPSGPPSSMTSTSTREPSVGRLGTQVSLDDL